ncbi:MAG: hypothetical protein JNG83_12200 [Opitutaceae bacterium]|nr:hypothetical protein [Opitutaceae bacterium]
MLGLLVLAAGWPAIGWTQAPQPFDPTAGMSPLERLAWDASFMVTPNSAGDPLQPVHISHALPFDSPDTHARSAPQILQRMRSNGRIPFLFLEANIRPHLRRGLVPVMLVGDLGLFTDRQVPVALHHPLEQLIRAKAARMPGGTFKMNGVPVVLGGREDLIRRLEAKDREREQAAALIREENKAKFSSDERHGKVFEGFSWGAFKELLGGRLVELSTCYPSRYRGPENEFADMRKNARERVAKGRLPLLFAPADSPKSALEGFSPLARIGAWGIWAPPDLAPADVSQLQKVLESVVADEGLREHASLWSVTEFGGADDLRQLVAASEERMPVASARVASPAPAAAPPPVKAAANPAVAEAHGPPLAPPPPRSSSEGPKQYPLPKPDRTGQGVKGLTCIDSLGQGWTGLSAEEKAKNARDQSEFRQRMQTKAAKIAELKKQKAKEDAARWETNLKVLQAWIQDKQAKLAALDEKMREKLHAEGSRSDAITYVIRDVDGTPSITLTNHTSVNLYVEFDYTGTVAGKPAIPSQDWTILPPGYQETRPLATLGYAWSKKLPWTAEVVDIRWWAREQDNKWRN